MAPLFLSAILSALLVASSTRGTVAIGVFQVRHKFSIMGDGCKGSDIGALQTHDRNRHLRRLVAADFSLGGLGGISTSSTRLYYTEIRIGTPAMQYYVQVDTGSSAFWVNCIPCKQCPRKSDILKKLTLYNPRSSVSSKVVKCDDMFCTSPDRDVQPECNTSLLCPFITTYADGGSTIGAFVTDLVHYNQLSGNGLTQSTNTSLTFGCGLGIPIFRKVLIDSPFGRSRDTIQSDFLNEHALEPRNRSTTSALVINRVET
ncbi:aspartic proteinase 36-like [Oryza glaberrima]|uniref:aspartic proteinase 36-like n=1 Tax=Oryza glaberrima TaxID=4538 RepID=UPI00224C2D2C|nr:aspartic proteinase 36-like [Oryza glaberrima]